MNIAIISPEFPPFSNWGGIATFNKNLALLLTQMGHEVFVFTLSTSALRTKSMSGFTIIPVELKTNNKFINFLYYRFPLGIIRYFVKIILPEIVFLIDWNIFCYLSFKSFQKKINFDVIHTPTYYSPALLICLFFKNIPCVQHLQGPQHLLNKYEIKSYSLKLKAHIENFYMNKLAYKIISCGKNLEHKTVQQFPSLKNKLFTFPNFIKSEDFSNNLPINVNNVVFMGRLDYRKGVEILLKAFIRVAKINRNLKLFLIGEMGSNFPYKKNYINFLELLERMNIPKKIKKRIFLLPRIDDRKTLIEVLKRLKGTAIFPSRYEPFGFVAIEAMAIGSVVGFTNNNEGIINDEKDGFYIKPTIKSIESFIKKVLLLSSSDIDSISGKAQKTVKNKYSFSALRKNYENFYDNNILN